MRKIFFGIIFLTILGWAFGAMAYTDVPETHPYAKAVQYFTELHVFQGYADGSFHPDAKVNRAEFVKIATLARNPDAKINYDAFAENCFPDVRQGDWFSSYVCYLKAQSFVSGHPNGSFLPASEVNLAEAAKMAVNMFELPVEENQNGQWYEPYLKVLADKKAIPLSLHYPNQTLKRAEIAEIFWRLRENITDLPSQNLEDLLATSCEKIDVWPKNIDLQKVRDTWMAWYNEEREKNGLQPYLYSFELERTALLWSQEAVNRGYIDHKRSGSAYYDYKGILAWMNNLDVEFENNAFAENIAWNVYRCNKADCTGEFLQAIRTGFDFFMSEKGKTYRPHYNAIVNPDYHEIGVGVAVDPVQGRFYLTTHIAKDVIAGPKVCP